MARGPYSARDLICKTFNNQPNILTPHVIRYDWRDGYAYELSEGTGLQREPIFGVTVVHPKRGHEHSLSQLFNTSAEALDYIARGFPSKNPGQPND